VKAAPVLIPPSTPSAISELALSESKPRPRALDTNPDLSRNYDPEYSARVALRRLCTPNFTLSLSDATFHPQPSRIESGLYISDLYTATRPGLLNALGITHVVCVMITPPTLPSFPPVERLVVPLDDSVHAPLRTHLPRAVQFITHARQNGGTVLVHCVWGVSRSPALVAAYLIARAGINVDQACARIARARVVSRPNDGFRHALEVWEREVRAGEQSGAAV